MDRQFFGSTDCAGAQVQYYLLVDNPECSQEEYGIEVVKDGEQAVIPALARSRALVQDLLESMVRCCVTPLSAWDVAEDWLLTL